MAVLGASKWPKLISRKIWVGENSWNFYTVYSQLVYPGLYKEFQFKLDHPVVFFLQLNVIDHQKWSISRTFLTFSSVTSFPLPKRGFSYTKALAVTHSVEISWFSYHSDFTWNQFWSLKKCEICHFKTFRGSEFWFQSIFAFFDAWNWPNLQNSEPQKG